MGERQLRLLVDAQLVRHLVQREHAAGLALHRKLAQQLRCATAHAVVVRLILHRGFQHLHNQFCQFLQGLVRRSLGVLVLQDRTAQPLQRLELRGDVAVFVQLEHPHVVALLKLDLRRAQPVSLRCVRGEGRGVSD